MGHDGISAHGKTTQGRVNSTRGTFGSETIIGMWQLVFSKHVPSNVSRSCVYCIAFNDIPCTSSSTRGCQQKRLRRPDVKVHGAQSGMKIPRSTSGTTSLGAARRLTRHTQFVCNSSTRSLRLTRTGLRKPNVDSQAPSEAPTPVMAAMDPVFNWCEYPTRRPV
jgi:hypothetical protein